MCYQEAIRRVMAGSGGKGQEWRRDGRATPSASHLLRSAQLGRCSERSSAAAARASTRASRVLTRAEPTRCLMTSTLAASEVAALLAAL